MALDPAALTAALIRCPSVTPEEGGALILLQEKLEAVGFFCARADRGGVPNLFARWGAKNAARRFGFNGHTDVVPPGDAAAWRHPPFAATEAGGLLYGRGAADMKSGVAAFVAAAVDFVSETPPPDGAVILTITGNEEGPGTDGTPALLDYMAAEGETMQVCLVGEPTSVHSFGDTVKIGRRGSLNAKVKARGVQGHAAYPHRAKNPLAALVTLLARLTEKPLDEGSAHFDPSTLALTSIDCGNPAGNVIPERAEAMLNIRFNDLHSGESLAAWLRAMAAEVSAETGVALEWEIAVSGESFLTTPGPFTALVTQAVKAETGTAPAFSTSGGTSDARFVKDHCPVVELGLVGQTMHQVDEHVEIAQIHRLKAVYTRILQAYFA